MNAAEFTLQRASSDTVPAGPALPPGPGGPALVQSLRLAMHPCETLEAWARRWGDCFSVRLLGGRINGFCSHPDAVRDIHAGEPGGVYGGEGAGGTLAPRPGRRSLPVRLGGPPQGR